MLSRREFLKTSALTGAGFALGGIWRVPRAYAAPLDPTLIPKWAQPLLVPPTATPLRTVRGVAYYDMPLSQSAFQVLPPPFPVTTSWGFGPLPILGPTIEARVGQPITVRWRNELGPASHLLPIDRTLHGTDMGEPDRRIVTHLHGGEVPMWADGYPEAWYTFDNQLNPNLDPALLAMLSAGGTYSFDTFTYDNIQHAATLWYHDHALAITRLNVYAGPAGLYLLRDRSEDLLRNSRQLPSGPYEIPIVIQDRQFDTNGQLFYPSRVGEGLLDFYSEEWEAAEHEVDEPNPTIFPEFAGDVAVVNGRAWPVLDVQQTWYRFRMLNGSDSRFYRLHLKVLSGGTLSTENVPIFQIGTDGGFLPAPVELSVLQIGPGERADILVNFGDFGANTELIWWNDAAIPFADPTEVPEEDDPTALWEIVKLKVTGRATRPQNTVRPNLDPTTLALPNVTPAFSLNPNDYTGANVRDFTLNEAFDSYGRLMPLLNGSEWHAVQHALLHDEPSYVNHFGQTVPTAPNRFQRGQTYLVNLVNMTEDFHPIHFHLRQFHLVGRSGTYAYVDENERGWKDTVQAPPETTTSIIISFPANTYAGLFPWHCHILSHEDHEMMLPYQVV